MGLCRDGALRRPGGPDLQGGVPVDGHLCDRGGQPPGRPVRADAGAGHRRGEVLPELK